MEHSNSPASISETKHHLPYNYPAPSNPAWPYQQKPGRRLRFNPGHHDYASRKDPVIIELIETANPLAPDRNTQLLLICVFLVVCVLALSVFGLFI